MDHQEYEIVTIGNAEVGLETTDTEEWTKEATSLLLELYNSFVDEDGILSKFRNKKSLWMFIADKIRVNLGIDKTHEQCYNRYRTILRRKRRDDIRTSTMETKKNIVPEIDQFVGGTRIKRNRASPTSDSSSPSGNESYWGTSRKSKRKRWRDDSVVALLHRLIDAVEKRERVRARQHEEKMVLLRRIADQLTCKGRSNRYDVYNLKCYDEIDERSPSNYEHFERFFRMKHIVSNCDNRADIQADLMV